MFRIWVSHCSCFDAGQISRSNCRPVSIPQRVATIWSLSTLSPWRLGDLNVEISVACPLAPHQTREAMVYLSMLHCSSMSGGHTSWDQRHSEGVDKLITWCSCCLQPGQAWSEQIENQGGKKDTVQFGLTDQFFCVLNPGSCLNCRWQNKGRLIMVLVCLGHWSVSTFMLKRSETYLCLFGALSASLKESGMSSELVSTGIAPPHCKISFRTLAYSGAFLQFFDKEEKMTFSSFSANLCFPRKVAASKDRKILVPAALNLAGFWDSMCCNRYVGKRGLWPCIQQTRRKQGEDNPDTGGIWIQDVRSHVQ